MPHAFGDTNLVSSKGPQCSICLDNSHTVSKRWIKDKQVIDGDSGDIVSCVECYHEKRKEYSKKLGG